MEQNKYISNTTVEQLNMFENLDKNVAVLMADGAPIIDGAIHICVTDKGLENAANKLSKFGEMSYAVSVLGMAIDNVFRQSAKALLVYGLALEGRICVITREDLECIQDVVDSFCIMYDRARGRISQQQAHDALKDKIMFFIGEHPSPENRHFGHDTLSRKDENGNSYDSIKLFLTRESASKFNGGNHTITETTLTWMEHLWKSKYHFIIEPHRNYWVEF